MLGCLRECHYVCRRIFHFAHLSFMPQVPYPPLRGTFPLRGRLNRCAKPPPSFLIREELSSTIKRGATPYGLPPIFPKESSHDLTAAHLFLRRLPLSQHRPRGESPLHFPADDFHQQRAYQDQRNHQEDYGTCCDRKTASRH